MDDNYNSLLKTNSEVVNETKPNDDVLKYTKFKIKNICKALCLPSQKYDPAKTVISVNSYLQEKNCKERLLYSEISSFVYGLPAAEQGNFATNVECLIVYVLDDVNSVDEEICRFIIKIYDHFQLAVNQKSLNAETNDIIKEHLIESINEAKNAYDNSAKNAKNIEKEYITILGIFASIVLSFVGGLTFSTSVLQNIDAVSIYRLLLVIDLIAVVLVNVIYLLINFICRINDKPVKSIGLIWFNIIFGVIGVLIITAWVLDFDSLVRFIRSKLCWIEQKGIDEKIEIKSMFSIFR